MLDLVVDTNVVLDLLLFRDPRAVVLREGLASGRYRWIACPPMRSELARVLDRGGFGRWAVDREAVLAAYDGSVVDIDPPASPGTLRCSDGDDQVFIDLAMQRRADALLTRDRALLRLAARALGAGVVVATPETWSAVCRRREMAG